MCDENSDYFAISCMQKAFQYEYFCIDDFEKELDEQALRDGIDFMKTNFEMVAKTFANYIGTTNQAQRVPSDFANTIFWKLVSNPIQRKLFVISKLKRRAKQERKNESDDDESDDDESGDEESGDEESDYDKRIVQEDWIFVGEDWCDGVVTFDATKPISSFSNLIVEDLRAIEERMRLRKFFYINNK